MDPCLRGWCCLFRCGFVWRGPFLVPSSPMRSEPLGAAFTRSDVRNRYQSHWTQMARARKDVPLPTFASPIHFGSCHPRPPRRSSSAHVTRTASSHQCFILFKRTLYWAPPSVTAFATRPPPALCPGRRNTTGGQSAQGKYAH